MVVSALQFVTPLIHISTLSITALSAVYVARQQKGEYGQVKALLILVHVLYIGIVSLEFVRNFDNDIVFMTLYTIGNTTFVLLDVAMLTVVALVVYYRPKGRGFWSIIAELSRHGRDLAFYALFCCYLVAAEGILVAFRPFSVSTMPNIVGASVTETLFNSFYLDILLGVLLVFMVYPSTLLFLASRRATNQMVRRALLLLPVAWIGIGLDLLIFNGYLLTVVQQDYTAIGYLIGATVFSISALIFRRATLLSGFFTFVSVPSTVPGGTVLRPFTLRVGIEPASIIGNTILMEIDPASNYERIIRDFVAEYTSAGYAIFTFTSKGSPVYNALASMQGVRLYLLTDKVSYARPGAEANEMLVPSGDKSVLLNTLHMTLNANPQVQVIVVFDSISDIILSFGLEQSYRFVKQANEMLSVSHATAMFLITKSAHTEKETSVVKSLFTAQFSYGDAGLEVIKTS